MPNDSKRVEGNAPPNCSAPRCGCCLVGHPIVDGYHIPTQRLGMIPTTECTLVRRGDVKRFRDHLNALPGPKHHNYQFQQRTRPYGDYLYAQDREKFVADMREWLMEQNTEVSNER